MIMHTGLTKFSLGEFAWNPKTSVLAPSKSLENRIARMAASAARQRPSPKKPSPKKPSPKKKASPKRPKGVVKYARTPNENFAIMRRNAMNRYKLLKELEASIARKR
jgi:hypothetical protein